MNRQWNSDELVEQYTLLPPEIEWLGENDDHNHLGKAILLKFFQAEGRFPENESEIPALALEHLAHQLGLPAEVLSNYQWPGRRAREHKRVIRELYGYRRATVVDQNALHIWLVEEVLPHEHRPTYLNQLLDQRLRQLHIEPPAKSQTERLIASAVHRYEQRFFTRTADYLSESVKANLRRLIYQTADLASDLALAKGDDPNRYPIHDLKSGSGAPNVANIKKVAERLKLLQ
jgi:hypothetical protein